MSDFENLPDNVRLAYAAGLFDGEGCTARRQTKNGNIEAPLLTITQHGDGVPEVLRRFQRAVNIEGKIYGPYVVPGCKQNSWKLTYRRQADMRAVMEALWPYLGEVKRAQFTGRFAEYEEDMARRAPLHPRNRTHCPNGHEKTPENTWTDPKTNQRQCRVCNRERMRNRSREARDATNAARRAARLAAGASPRPARQRSASTS